MNKQESDILNSLLVEPFINQRILSEYSGHSLGVVNRSIKNLIKDGMLDEYIRPTARAKEELKRNSPKNAIILAAGFGMRMVPINTQTPKALIEVNGEVLIERVINQLHEVGIKEIYIVVGFMKEQFEYLIDLYGVKLIINTEYAAKNNLHSLNMAASYISNTYIIPSDIWCDRNPFNRHELYSWYMVSDLIDDDSSVRVNRKMELVSIDDVRGGNQMIGVSYLVGEEGEKVRARLKNLDKSKRYEKAFWEEALFEKDRMIVRARVVHASDVVEINTYEQLRELDEDSNHLNTDAIDVIANTFGVSQKEIIDIDVIKKGMTNSSFLFSCRDKQYVMRIPGIGTDKLINRGQEAAVYDAIKGKTLCDDPVYINPENGYKITKFLNDVRPCDINSETDLRRCMTKLKELHALDLNVGNTFDIFEQIDFYESLWEGTPSIYRDYLKTKANVFSLRDYIEKHRTKWSLTHIDAVPDNFLFYKVDGEEKLQLTDWEYSGMQDPHVDIAMFAIYAMYDKTQIDNLINIYFDGECDKCTRTKIYCYIATCGLLWSNWCEYKRCLGVEFGEYSIRQYRYAKDFYNIVKEELNDESK